MFWFKILFCLCFTRSVLEKKKGYQEMKEKRISGLNSFKLNDFKIYLWYYSITYCSVFTLFLWNYCIFFIILASANSIQLFKIFFKFFFKFYSLSFLHMTFKKTITRKPPPPKWCVVFIYFLICFFEIIETLFFIIKKNIVGFTKKKKLIISWKGFYNIKYFNYLFLLSNN